LWREGVGNVAISEEVTGDWKVLTLLSVVRVVGVRVVAHLQDPALKRGVQMCVRDAHLGNLVGGRIVMLKCTIRVLKYSRRQCLRCNARFCMAEDGRLTPGNEGLRS